MADGAIFLSDCFKRNESSRNVFVYMNFKTKHTGEKTWSADIMYPIIACSRFGTTRIFLYCETCL